MINSTAHARKCAIGGSSGDTRKIATPIKTTPKNRLTVSIQGPAFGNSVPAEAPTTSSGTPMPSASENKAAPPNTVSPDLLM